MAIVVAHGMGQQIPFQTLDCPRGCATDRKRRDRRRAAEPVARRRLGGDVLPVRMKLLAGDCERDVHIYESYWAPMTEGRVTLRDVMGFLMRGGMGGLRLARRPLRRWLFGEFVKFPAPLMTVLWLLLSMSVVIALTFLSVVIVIVAGATAAARRLAVAHRYTRFSDITTVFNVHVSAMGRSCC